MKLKGCILEHQVEEKGFVRFAYLLVPILQIATVWDSIHGIDFILLRPCDGVFLTPEGVQNLYPLAMGRVT